LPKNNIATLWFSYKLKVTDNKCISGDYKMSNKGNGWQNPISEKQRRDSDFWKRENERRKKEDRDRKENKPKPKEETGWYKTYGNKKE
jgi:hypothetical protein